MNVLGKNREHSSLLQAKNIHIHKVNRYNWMALTIFEVAYRRYTAVHTVFRFSWNGKAQTKTWTVELHAVGEDKFPFPSSQNTCFTRLLHSETTLISEHLSPRYLLKTIFLPVFVQNMKKQKSIEYWQIDRCGVKLNMKGWLRKALDSKLR